MGVEPASPMKCKAQDALIPKSRPHRSRRYKMPFYTTPLKIYPTHRACLIRIIPFNGAIRASVKRIHRRSPIYRVVYRVCIYTYTCISSVSWFRCTFTGRYEFLMNEVLPII